MLIGIFTISANSWQWYSVHFNTNEFAYIKINIEQGLHSSLNIRYDEKPLYFIFREKEVRNCTAYLVKLSCKPCTINSLRIVTISYDKTIWARWAKINNLNMYLLYFTSISVNALSFSCTKWVSCSILAFLLSSLK